MRRVDVVVVEPQPAFEVNPTLRRCPSSVVPQYVLDGQVAVPTNNEARYVGTPAATDGHPSPPWSPMIHAHIVKAPGVRVAQVRVPRRSKLERDGLVKLPYLWPNVPMCRTERHYPAST